MELPASLEESLAFLAPRIEERHEHQVRIRTFPFAIVGGGRDDGRLDLSLAELDPTQYSPDNVGAKLLGPHTIALNGRDRFNLATGSQTGALDGPPTTHWMAVERDPAIYAQVNSMIHAAFERHLVVQTFRPPQLEPALSDEPVPNDLRQSTSEDAVQFQKRATPLEEFSDGVKVYCGMVAALATVPHLLLLIDEPEAFLHPTLSRRLGANLARLARERDARMICATHSADFLLGCLSEVPQTTVIRLDYRRETPGAHLLHSSEVEKLSRDPLLRSADALDALFARSAVVCEADSDRAFYEEINRRLLDTDGRTGALDPVFLNAQNWQTTLSLAKPLRQAGVPAAVVLDLDTLAADDIWPDLVAMGEPSNEDRDRILTARAAARDAIKECGRPAPEAPLRVKINGLGALNEEQNLTVEAAIEELARIGVFVVDVGELENWLPQLGCTNKQRWLTDMLTCLGAPDDANYIAPGIGDVWDFVEQIAHWLEDPARAGMPAA
jgi:AAA domain, putative AbiEii toxin, Type IV TA system